MKYKYQTSFATLIQFIVVVLLSLLDTLIGIIATCHSDSTQCISNAIPSMIFFILTAGWFGIIALFGFLTQEKRDRKLAAVLFGLEFITLLVAGYFNLPREKGINNKLTSLIDALFALWVLYLTVNVFLSNKKRIVKNAPRKRLSK